MEQQSHSSGISEKFSDLSTDKHPSGTSIKHSAGYRKMTCHEPGHIFPYRFYPDPLDGYDVNGEAYSGGMDVIRNIANDNFLDVAHMAVKDPRVASESDDYDYPPFENFHYAFLDNQCEWHQDDFYNGANIEIISPPEYSTGRTNYTSYFRKGTMYFIPHQSTSNSFYTGHATYAQSEPGLTNTRINHPDVAHAEVQLNSTYSENSHLDSTTVESHKEAKKPETPLTDATDTESLLGATYAETPRIDATVTESLLEATNAETPLTDAESRLKAANAEIPRTLTTDAESWLEAANAETPRIDAADAESLLEATNAETPLTDAESRLEAAVAEIPRTRATNDEAESCKHVDGKDGKNVSDHVENGGRGGQKDRNLNVSSNANRRNKRGNSRKGCGNIRRNNSKADAARYRDSQSSEFCTGTCPVHCDNGNKSPENKTSADFPK